MQFDYTSTSHHRMYHAVIGLDLSITSPGVAVCIIKDAMIEQCSWEFYCFAQRDSDLLAPKREPRLTVWQMTTGTGSSDGARYHEVVQRIESIAVNVISRIGGVRNLTVCIEGYAYGRTSSSGHAYKLFELGGAVRMKLHTMGVNAVRIVSPSSWKRVVLNTGSADKASACKWARDRHIIDLGSAFRVRHRICTASTEGSRNSVPNPIQDVADAVCIASYIVMEITGSCISSPCEKPGPPNIKACTQSSAASYTQENVSEPSQSDIVSDSQTMFNTTTAILSIVSESTHVLDTVCRSTEETIRDVVIPGDHCNKIVQNCGDMSCKRRMNKPIMNAVNVVKRRKTPL